MPSSSRPCRADASFSIRVIAPANLSIDYSNSRGLAVVCHDAGAANIVLAWIEADLLPAHRLYLEGPAATLWRSQARPEPHPSLEAALTGADTLVSGTGWASDLEHKARRIARQSGMRSIAVIDHWINYGARFARDGETILPDQIWITDAFAEAIARRNFPRTPVFRVPNLYLENQVREIAGMSAEPRDVLYVLEPARAQWGRERPGEFQALDYFMGRLDCLRIGHQTPLRFRPHPSDPPGKYDQWLASHRDTGAQLDTIPRLSQSIARAKVVVGLNSFALVIALAAGRRAVCSLPPWAPACVLPHGNLVHLKELG